MKLTINLMIDEEDEGETVFASNFEINNKSMISNKKIISNVALKLWREIMLEHKNFNNNGKSLKPADIKKIEKEIDEINKEEKNIREQENLHAQIGINAEKIINELNELS